MSNMNFKSIALGLVVGIVVGFLLNKKISSLSDTQAAKSPPIRCPEVPAQPVCPTQTPEEPVGEIVKLADGTFPPPNYSNDMPEIFETKHPGEFKVVWESVPGVTKYRIRIYDPRGNSVRSYSVPGKVAYIQRIPWNGSDSPYVFYKINISSLNEENKEGPKGETRKVKLYKDHAFFGTVGKANKLVAPEIKAIVTED